MPHGQCKCRGYDQCHLSFSSLCLACNGLYFFIVRRILRGRSPFSPDMEHFHHRLMAKGLSHGKAVLAMWAAAFTCSFVAVAAALGKGDQLTALFVFFGFGGFILLRYLGYFRFEFFGQGFSSLLQDRKSARTAEQAVKDAEDMLGQMDSIEGVSEALGKAAEGMQFQEVSLALFEEANGKLGIKGEATNSTTRKSIWWKDPEQSAFILGTRNSSRSLELTEEILRTVRSSIRTWMEGAAWTYRRRSCSNAFTMLWHPLLPA